MTIQQIAQMLVRMGLKSDLPSNLNPGEFGFCVDTRELYIGNGLGFGGNSLISSRTGYTLAELLASQPQPLDRAFVTDLTTIPTFGSLASAATGGSNSVAPVYYDGTAWRIG